MDLQGLAGLLSKDTNCKAKDSMIRVFDTLSAQRHNGRCAVGDSYFSMSQIFFWQGRSSGKVCLSFDLSFIFCPAQDTFDHIEADQSISKHAFRHNSLKHTCP